MGKVILDQSVSLDGFSAGPNSGHEYPLGEGGLKLHEWLFSDTGRIARQLENNPVDTAGAVILGKRMYEPGVKEWGGVTPFAMPAFLLCHTPPAVLLDGFTVVTDGIESALRQAKAAAGDKNIWLVGGANVAQQYLKAGLVDEIRLHLVPVLLGQGRRFFENIGSYPIEMEIAQVVEAPGVTHLRYILPR